MPVVYTGVVFAAVRDTVVETGGASVCPVDLVVDVAP